MQEVFQSDKVKQELAEQDLHFDLDALMPGVSENPDQGEALMPDFSDHGLEGCPLEGCGFGRHQEDAVTGGQLGICDELTALAADRAPAWDRWKIDNPHTAGFHQRELKRGQVRQLTRLLITLSDTSTKS